MNFSIKEMFRASWATFKRSPWVFVGAMAVIVAVSIITDTITKNAGDGLEFLFNIASVVLLWWLYLGFLQMAFTAYAGGIVQFDMLFSGKWPMLLQFGIAAILTGILVAVGIVLLIVPGIIAQVGLLFGALFVVDKEMKGIDAMKASWNLTKGRRWDLFLMCLMLVLLNIGGALALGVGLFVTVPMTAIALVYLYRQLEKHIQPQVVAPAHVS